tara:strand:+ start:10698 stop:10967 length:270 start_codon:yes stop_codon:yes gene_type:complete
LAAETVTIKVATFVPEKSTGVSKGIKPWMDAVSKDAGFDVKMQAFWGCARSVSRGRLDNHRPAPDFGNEAESETIALLAEVTRPTPSSG